MVDLMQCGEVGEPWTGVRNYQARNFMRDGMSVGDGVLIYHSSCKQVGVAGLAQICGSAVADETQFDENSAYYDAKSDIAKPRWVAVQVQGISAFSRVIPLTEIKELPVFRDSPLSKKGQRLSVIPITEEQWNSVLVLANRLMG